MDEDLDKSRLRPVASERIPRPPKGTPKGSITTRSVDGTTKSILRQDFMSELDKADQLMKNMDLSDPPAGAESQKPDILIINPPDLGGVDINGENAQKDRYFVLEAKRFARPKLRKLSPRKQNDYWDQSPEKPPRKSVFPEQCRNTFALRRLMDEKADKLITSWSPEARRKREVKKILAKVSFPQMVSRNQTTSAIFRDYKHLKERRGRKYSPSLSKRNSRPTSKEVTFDIAKVLKLPPMSQEEKVSMLHREDKLPMVERSSTVA